MRFKQLYFILAFLLFGQSFAQSFTNSNLPIIVIQTSSDIQDYSRIYGTMTIINRGSGQRNALSDISVPEAITYSGLIDIELRGSSSQSTPKKSYGFSTLLPDGFTGDNVSLLGMPAEHDWILNGMVFDPACMRDFICFNLSRQLGEYASRTEYCEVVINGEYKGLYLLQEKIKADDNRVDINKILPEDNFVPNITGGYIVKADKTTGDDPVAWTMTTWQSLPVNYIHHFPNPNEITSLQHEYIKEVFVQLSEECGNASITDGFPSIIDIPSFINYMIIEELSSNADGYHLSTFFHKDRNGKLRAGPVWDNDLTFGYDLTMWGYDRSKHDVWQHSAFGNDGSAFWRNLFLHPDFRCYLSRRWHAVSAPGQPLNEGSLYTLIESTAAYISEAHSRNRAKWKLNSSLQTALASIESFITSRIGWINQNIGSFDDCAVIDVPDLVITKIMYQPQAGIGFINADEQEFIEITNSGNEQANLTGVYFKGTGFVYQFPAGTIIESGESVIIAADTLIFERRYGYKAYGEYNRHLSNSGQCLLLSDAFGNTIDSVQYQNIMPWPDVNANGSCLLLTDISLDNSLAENWTALEVAVSSGQTEYGELQIYPNPFTDIIYLDSDQLISSFEISDISGHIVLSQKGVPDGFIQAGFLKPGAYIIKLIINDRMITRKIIKTK